MRTFIFKNSRNDAVTLAVNALDEKTAVATMANVVGNCDNWEVQYDFEMEDLTDDYIGGSDDALDHTSDEVSLDDWDEESEYGEADWTDSRNPAEDEDSDERGYN